jgi:hypothetical protein
MSLSRIVKSKGIYFTSCYLFYENIFPGRNNDPFSNAQSSSFFHLLVISSHELSHSIVSNTLFPNVYLQSLILHILIWDNLLIIFTFNLLSICFLHYFEFTTLPIPSSFVANLSSNFHNQCIYICAVFCTNTFIWCYAIQNWSLQA